MKWVVLILQERNGNGEKARHRGCKDLADSPREELRRRLLEVEAGAVGAGAEAVSGHPSGDTRTAWEVLRELVWKIITKTLAKDDDTISARKDDLLKVEDKFMWSLFFFLIEVQGVGQG